MAGPADKSKHAPSVKHTLDEVLRSLQDLVRNELHDASANPAAPAPPASPADMAAAPTADEMIARLEASLAELQSAGTTHRDARPAASASSANPLAEGVAAPGAGHGGESPSASEDKQSTPAVTRPAQIRHITVDAARTLQDLALPQPTPGSTTPTPPATAAGPDTQGITAAAKPSHAAGMQQQALPLPDPAAGNEPPSASDTENGRPASGLETLAAPLEVPVDLPAAAPEVDLQPVPELQLTAEITAAEGASAASASSADEAVIVTAGGMQEGHLGQMLHAPAEVDVHWDDFPVLENAIDLASVTPSELADVAKPASTDGTPPRSTTVSAAVASIDAHRLAIMAAARLNMELRKSGKRALSTAVIARLAQILKEMLAQGAPNVENSRGKED